MRKKLLVWLGGCGLLAVLLVAPHVLTRPHPIHVLTMIFLYGLLGTAWNLLGGFAGQVSFGHAIFFGTGAYTTTLLLTKGGISPVAGIFAGAALATLIAVLIGWGCFRLAGHYFAIATFTINEIVHIIAANWKYIGAAVGIYVPLDRQFNWWRTLQFPTKTGPYYIALGLCLTGLLIAWTIDRSRAGAYFRAIKADPEAARALGINLFRQKMLAIILSASLTALAGGFFAQYVLYVDPDSVLSVPLSITISLVAILGGAGSLWGPIAGAAVLIPLSEYGRAWLGGRGQGLDLLIYGLLIVVVSVYQPRGLAGLWERLKFGGERRLARRVAAGS